jgi:hypothetical protein
MAMKPKRPDSNAPFSSTHQKLGLLRSERRFELRIRIVANTTSLLEHLLSAISERQRVERKFEKGNKMSERKVITTQQIEQRAYEIYLERGGEDGRSIEDWLAAEKELTGLPEQTVPTNSRSRAASGAN